MFIALSKKRARKGEKDNEPTTDAKPDDSPAKPERKKTKKEKEPSSSSAVVEEKKPKTDSKPKSNEDKKAVTSKKPDNEPKEPKKNKAINENKLIVRNIPFSVLLYYFIDNLYRLKRKSSRLNFQSLEK